MKKSRGRLPHPIQTNQNPNHTTLMKSVFLTIAAVMVAGLAFAADGDGGKGKGKGGGNADPAKRAEAMMKQLDSNKDGKISKEEYAAGPMASKMKEKGGDGAVDKAFGRLDKNSDGNIDLDELKAMPARKPGGDKGKGKGKGKGDA